MKIAICDDEKEYVPSLPRRLERSALMQRLLHTLPEKNCLMLMNFRIFYCLISECRRSAVWMLQRFFGIGIGEKS